MGSSSSSVNVDIDADIDLMMTLVLDRLSELSRWMYSTSRSLERVTSEPRCISIAELACCRLLRVSLAHAHHHVRSRTIMLAAGSENGSSASRLMSTTASASAMRADARWSVASGGRRMKMDACIELIPLLSRVHLLVSMLTPMVRRETADAATAAPEMVALAADLGRSPLSDVRSILTDIASTLSASAALHRLDVEVVGRGQIDRQARAPAMELVYGPGDATNGSTFPSIVRRAPSAPV